MREKKKANEENIHLMDQSQLSRTKSDESHIKFKKSTQELLRALPLRDKHETIPIWKIIKRTSNGWKKEDGQANTGFKFLTLACCCYMLQNCVVHFSSKFEMDLVNAENLILC